MSEKKVAHKADKAEKVEKATGAHPPQLPFVRIGGELLNLGSVAKVTLPVSGDPKHPLTLVLANGTNLTLTGDAADEVLALFASCCDVTPEKPVKTSE